LPQISAGLLMFRNRNGVSEVFLVHPGGPFFRNKDLGFWTIPKGLQEPDEELLLTAQREFEEETGIKPSPPYVDLGFTKLKSGKIVHAWGFETSLETVTVISNNFTLEWPPKSGKWQDFPEIDKAGFFEIPEAVRKINEAQKVFIERLKSIKGY